MIEAVENHMPETIIIDEIGTELEALAASTIAQRGVQLVGTAHGMTIDNIIKNPSLQILVGGIEVQSNSFCLHFVSLIWISVYFQWDYFAFWIYHLGYFTLFVLVCLLGNIL